MRNCYEQYVTKISSHDDKPDYITSHYDVRGFYDLLFDTEDACIGRIRNLLINAINTEQLLPKAIIIVLDDDILDDLNHFDIGISVALGKWIEWLTQKFHEIIQDYKKILQSKSRKYKYPHFVWCLLPQHMVFAQFNDYKEKFNTAVKKATKNYREMSTISLNLWNSDDMSYFDGGQISQIGMATYWQAINAAFKVWDRSQMKTEHMAHLQVQQQSQNSNNYKYKAQPIVTRERRHNIAHKDKYHWHAEKHRPESKNQNKANNFPWRPNAGQRS